MTWACPEAFWLLLLLPLACWPLLGRGRAAARLPGLHLPFFHRSQQSFWGPRVLVLLRASTLVLLIAALARPQAVDARSHAHTNGIAIQLVLDTSNSMGYTDYSLNGQTVTRLDAARHAIRLFVKGEEKSKLPGRKNDQIGLVTFNRYPDVACPLTHSHDTLLSALDQVNLGPHTNIGDGLAWGLDRLRKVETKGKVLILLSDGKQNLKDALDPEEAAKIAAELGIRVYSIGAVGNRTSTGSLNGLLRGLAQPQGRSLPNNPADSIDEGVLRRVAEKTGGKYYRATDTDGLLGIYREIDQLETSRIERSETVNYDEWYLLPLLVGLAALGLEQLLGATRFLVVP